MIDLNKIEKYRENNRIEAKKALGRLPKSIWETYSAFANTMGGIILLGVEEYRDKSLHAIKLPDPDKIIEEFWNVINNPQKVSLNILNDRHIAKYDDENKTIIAITVPRAQRTDKPVFIDGNPMAGTYRRNGEGDYKCSNEEVQAMFRDAGIKTQDMKVLEETDMNVFDFDCVKRYRIRMENYRPGHVWEELENGEFLYRLGGVARGTDGKLHPTAAGLLMFGYEYEIVREFPNFFLDYQEQMDDDTRWTDRIISTAGDWSGNVYDFYFKVYNKIKQSIKTPFKLEGGDRIDDTPIHQGLREALANALINADYYDRGGVVVKKYPERVEISNPGGFRIGIDDAISGGFSDPRNATLMKMFNLINVGERAGSGIPNIYRIWKREGLSKPELTEKFEPDRIILTLAVKTADKTAEEEEPPINNGENEAEEEKPPINNGENEAKEEKPPINNGGNETGEEKPPIKPADKEDEEKKRQTKTAGRVAVIIDYLTYNPSAKAAEIGEVVGTSPRRTREILKMMIEKGIVETEGGRKNRVYMLKR